MFLEKRVYQGSSGKVYPYPVIDKIYDEKKDREYNIVFLENEYIQVQVIPELGGRIYRALDKTNNYDFVYYNRVIKPALVGLVGPWISGGIEFNWPQHHRPNTYGPCEYRIDDSHADCKTVYLSERDRIYGSKMTMGISLREGCAAIEISVELYNPTSESSSFLWWANPAVRVHDKTQSIFPPDVHAVMDHGKRDVSRFPIATGTYYKMDYSRGVDISRYKNIPVPTSYMAYKSEYDFVGGYDWEAEAGILHVADHHISPGKKQWTWGYSEFGKAWDRNLTDEDGPYIELMTGVFTDNQPDFTWLSPYSGKNFTQYFMPYKKLGEVSAANKDAAIALKIIAEKATVKVYGSRKIKNARIALKGKSAIYIEEITDLSPLTVFEKTVPVQDLPHELTLTLSADGINPLIYRSAAPAVEKIPDPARLIGEPESLPNTEALFLAGLHLEQYRHATYNPDAYYREGLKRDPSDIRLNNAYGNRLYQAGDFDGAEKHFEAARISITRHNPNPRDGEICFNLGKALEAQDRLDEAFDAYYKAIWSDPWRSSGYFKLAQLSSRKGDYKQAIEYGYESLYANYKNFKTRALLLMLLRKTGEKAKAERMIEETLGFDKLDFTALYEKYLWSGGPSKDCPSKNGTSDKDFLANILRGDPHACLTLAINYSEAGFYAEAISVLSAYLDNSPEPYAIIYYFLASFMEKSPAFSAASSADAVWKQASQSLFRIFSGLQQ
jgi:tetratricopeptide (TPR) repeat protein